jgi:thioredoxin 1
LKKTVISKFYYCKVRKFLVLYLKFGKVGYILMASAGVLEITDGNFEAEVANSSVPVLLDFWAAWCAPCRMLAPTVEAIAKDYDGKAKVGKLNVDENNEISAKYGIKGIPTLILFKNGVEQERVVGATTKDNIARMLDKHL